ncbi:unnamed protein product [Rotaria socialis]|uniref:Uncharacterized protein n=1 Tax=Rotaria socialis TaxID=392032 RepID=A0A821J1T1_9BILA|nr:unnamed protein product [Rotaria socialis]CAF4711049.1 unnamed protein product [Rotaria socialis]
MLRFFFRYGWVKLCYVFIGLLFLVVLFIYTFSRENLSKTTIKTSHTSSSPILSSSIRTHDFRLYSESRPFLEYNRIQINDIAQSMFNFNKSEVDEKNDYSKAIEYSESKFRFAPIPIVWLDEYGDVHWNRAAQYETLYYLLAKQFPNENISTCLTRQLIILEQWPMGFFSRHHCLIEHFGQTLYSPSMTLLMPRRLVVSNAAVEDFQNEGILRYYQSISLCSSYLHHPTLKSLHDRIQSTDHTSKDTKVIHHINQLIERDESTVKFKYSRDIWKFGYDHVPHRRWLFDRNRKEIKKMIDYHSPIKSLIDHSNEHIYFYNSSSFNLTAWIPRNSPQGPPKEVLAGTTTNLTIRDKIFTSFLRYMFLLFLSPLAPRIQTSAKLLAHHWSEYLSDKYNKPYNVVLSKMAVVFIRRGDKMPEDSFWHKHRRWRNISMYVKGIVDEEKRRQINYTAIFVMTDDVAVMKSIQEYARVGLIGVNNDEPYARRHLHGREILFNVFAPQSCFDPFVRIGFDQFLVNVQFITDHASLVVGHTDSNVGRYLEEIIYVNRQHEKNVRTLTYVINAPDSLD